MARLPFTTDDSPRPTIGCVVLRTDEVLEDELRQMIPADVSLHVTRIPSSPDVTAETLATMEAALPDAVALFPDRPFAAVGYGCTSGATIIGSSRVADLVRGGCDVAHVTDPLRATISALRALNVRRLAFVTPYVPAVSDLMRQALTDAGIEIAAFGSFEEVSDSRVAQIDTNSIQAAITSVASSADCDAVFLSCTNLRALHLLAEAEAQLQMPVVSSNLALGWHLCGLAQVPMELQGIALPNVKSSG